MSPETTETNLNLQERIAVADFFEPRMDFPKEELLAETDNLLEHYEEVMVYGVLFGQTSKEIRKVITQMKGFKRSKKKTKELFKEEYKKFLVIMEYTINELDKLGADVSDKDDLFAFYTNKYMNTFEK